MSPSAFISALRSRGIEFQIDQSFSPANLKVRAPEGFLTPDLIDAIKSRKEDLIDCLIWDGNRSSSNRSNESIESREAFSESDLNELSAGFDGREIDRHSAAWAKFKEQFGSSDHSSADDGSRYDRMPQCPRPARLGSPVRTLVQINFIDHSIPAHTHGLIVERPDYIQCPHRQLLAREGIREQQKRIDNDEPYDPRMLVWLEGEVRWLRVDQIERV